MTKIGTYLQTIFGRNSISPEQDLFLAVIIQQFYDALSRSYDSEARSHKRDALDWLQGNSKGFKDICHAANIDPDFVRRKAKEAIRKNHRINAAPKQGFQYLLRKKHRDKLKKIGRPLRLTYAGKPVLKLIKHEESQDA